MDGPTAALQTTLESARQQFLSTLSELRPKLHRFCSRMCGSVLDGEDVVQETLAEAFYHLNSLKEANRLEPWLFRIAHHKCVDHIRRQRRQREDNVPFEEEQNPLDTDVDVEREPLSEPLTALIGELPPKERAAVLLKDVLQYSLAEVAEVVSSSVGGVKAALHRGRAKLLALQSRSSQPELDRQQERLLRAYVECFNRQDWDSLRQLIHADATLEVVDGTFGKLRDMPYFGRYAQLPWEWRLSLGRVDGEPVVVHWKKRDGAFVPVAAVRLWWEGRQIVRIRDYSRIDYLLAGPDAQVQA